MKRLLLFLSVITCSSYAQLAPLTVEKIMRDPKWIGVAPSNVSWSEDSKSVYFSWNPDKNEGDSLYVISLTNRTPQKVSAAVRRGLPSVNGVYNKARTKKIFEKNGDLFLLDLPTNKRVQITSTNERESNPQFSMDERKVLFSFNMNLYSWEIANGSFAQLTDFKRGTKRPDAKLSEQEKWLKADQLAYFEILKQRNEAKKATDKNLKADRPKRPKEIYLDDKNVDQVQLSPDGNYITYRLTKVATPKNTIIPNYVTESGFTEDITGRSKVGAAQSTNEFFVYDLAKDTVLVVKTNEIPGIFDIPEYKKEYPAKTKPADDKKEKKPEPRPIALFGPYWSEDGKNNVMI
ncbi:MAG: S9 family peptidase, partial [Cytophaga sp.]|nr:S9 family peptidase [Cytophaga sp.]